MWTEQNGKFVYQDVARHNRPRVHHVPTSSWGSSHVHEAKSHIHDEGGTTADTGTFVDADGLPANGSAVAGIAQAGQIVSSGIVNAYVIDVPPRAKLSGIYSRTINGVTSGKVVVIYNEDSASFVMASTKSNELEEIKLRFDALVGS